MRVQTVTGMTQKTVKDVAETVFGEIDCKQAGEADAMLATVWLIAQVVQTEA